jgi:2-epi-5-epi-valiolone synthase
MTTRQQSAQDEPGHWVISTELPVHFTIKNSPGIFAIGNEDVLQFGGRNPGRRLIVLDQNLREHYLAQIIEYFRHYQIDFKIVPLSVSEERKDLERLTFLLAEMEQFGLVRRDEPLIAVGGGVLLDIAGLAANLYRRGIPYVRVPTTLVGLVDASVGAKTGINFEDRRNRLGSYYPPIAAYLDKAFLRTLAPIEISSGLGEILKMAVIKDYRLFELLERWGKPLFETKFGGVDCADEVINRATSGMKEELEPNLWEKNLERIVDFGHSFSPIIEMRSLRDKHLQPLTHGQAVTLDVLFSCVVSHQRGLLDHGDLVRVIKTARQMDLPTCHRLFVEPLHLLEALRDTMKHRNGAQNLPIPRAIGDAVFVNDLTFEEIKAAAQQFKAENEALFGEFVQ